MREGDDDEEEDEDNDVRVETEAEKVEEEDDEKVEGRGAEENKALPRRTHISLSLSPPLSPPPKSSVLSWMFDLF